MQDVKDSTKQEEILLSTTDAAEWNLEVERVLPQLKVTVRTDNKVCESGFSHACMVIKVHFESAVLFFYFHFFLLLSCQELNHVNHRLSNAIFSEPLSHTLKLEAIIFNRVFSSVM